MTEGSSGCIHNHKAECASYAPFIVLREYNIDNYDEDGEYILSVRNNVSSFSNVSSNNNDIMSITSLLTELNSPKAVSSMDGY